MGTGRYSMMPPDARRGWWPKPRFTHVHGVDVRGRRQEVRLIEASPLRAWSGLSEAERNRLLADYQLAMDREAPTCEFGVKLARMQRWLADRGVSITEAEIRGKR